MEKYCPRSIFYESAKRGLDLIGAGLGLVALSPVLILFAILTKLSSPGPVFYRGQRTGRYGKMFRIFKFRTMVVNAEKLGGPTTGLNDSRVTKIGAFLRQYKLDELPQLINVLIGDMSLVGPRPEVKMYTDLFKGEEEMILTVRPGITDFASIAFSNLDELVGSDNPDKVFEEQILSKKNALRVRYVKERSLLLDLKLIALTIRVIFDKAAASRVQRV